MAISRRGFLKGSAVAAGAGAALVFGRQWTRSTAEAAPHHQADGEEFEHRGKKVKIKETDQTVDVWIDGNHQHHIKKLRKGRYATHLLPFDDFQNVKAMVKELIDKEEDEELFGL